VFGRSDEFIGSLSIDVVSCHEVKPRSRRNRDEDAVDRKAFRVCVFDVDRDRLLDAGAWPDSITISKWFFKQNAEEGAAAGDKRRRIGSDQNHDNARPVQSLHRVAQQVSDVASGGADAAACNVDRIEVDIRAENDADDTILVNDYNVNDGE